jgi:hypothetical protein
VRTLVVDASVEDALLLDALWNPGPLELVLAAPPRTARLDLLAAAARPELVLVTRFAGTLATPLVELALLSLASAFDEDARLDFSGALLTPLVARLGLARARRLLARVGEPLLARDVLTPWRGSAGRSAPAVGLVRALLAARAGPRELLAEERAAFRLAMTLPDRREGIAAFRERRPPRFDW